MDFFNNGSKYFNKSVSAISDDKILESIVSILLILFAVLVAPKLPQSVTTFVNNIYFKIIFILALVLLAKKYLVISLICLIIFFVIINNKKTTTPSKQRIPNTTTPNTTTTNTTMPKLISINPTTISTESPPRYTQPPITLAPVIQPLLTNVPINDTVILPTFAPIINQPVIPNIPIAVASTYALSPSMRADIINGSTIPINNNITPTTASTIIAINPIANNIVTKIKENFTNYINNSVTNEKTMRNQAETHQDGEISQYLLNSADKVAIGRNAISSIINKNDATTNDLLIKSLVKSDLFNDAAMQALQSGDNLSAQQLNQVSLSQSNVANALVQSKILKLTAQNNPSSTDASKLLDIANNHLNASLNIINYNNNMESSLDAHVKGNINLAKQYEDKASLYLKNNVTLSDKIKGIPVKSNILYAEVYDKTPNLVPPKSKCDNISAVSIPELEDYANF
jgi:hypothetical protein